MNHICGNIGMTKKNNVFQLSLVKENRDRKKIAKIAPLTPAELIKKEYFELIIKSLLSALKCKDDYTWGHSLRVAYFCVSVGREMGLSEQELYELEVSALFHDIGKIGVPDSVLLKPSRLTDEEGASSPVQVRADGLPRDRRELRDAAPRLRVGRRLL